MDPQPELSIATVLFGGEDVLVQTMPTWSAAVATAGLDVVIVDNSADERAAELARDALPNADLVRRPSNPGFAASANEALARARTDWVLLLNADVFLNADALRTCVEWIADPRRDGGTECAAISLITDGEEFCGVELNAVGWFSDRPAASGRPPLGPSGGAMLIERATFDRVNGYDADLFAWGEDAGLSLRLAASGVRTTPLRLGLRHTGGHSVPTIAGQRFKARLLARNRIRVMRRDWTLPLRLVVGPAHLLLLTANGVRKLRFGTSRMHFRGIRDGFLERGAAVSRRSAFGLRDFVRYRAARTAATR